MMPTLSPSQRVEVYVHGRLAKVPGTVLAGALDGPQDKRSICPMILLASIECEPSQPQAQ